MQRKSSKSLSLDYIKSNCTLAQIRIHTVCFKYENVTLLAPSLLKLVPFDLKNEHLYEHLRKIKIKKPISNYADRYILQTTRIY